MKSSVLGRYFLMFAFAAKPGMKPLMCAKHQLSSKRMETSGAGKIQKLSTYKTKHATSGAHDDIVRVNQNMLCKRKDVEIENDLR
jgi:hypothetical protein